MLLMYFVKGGSPLISTDLRMALAKSRLLTLSHKKLALVLSSFLYNTMLNVLSKNRQSL